MPTDRKQIRRTIEEWFDGSVGSLLVRNGFEKATEGIDHREPLQMFRSQAKKIEVVGCRIAQRAGMQDSELFAEVGIFLRNVPHYSGAVFVGVENLPLRSTLDCHFRRALKPSWRLNHSLSRRATWCVKSSGQNLEDTLSDVINKMGSIGLPWFEKYTDMHAAYRVLTGKHGSNLNLPGNWGQVYGESLVKGYLGLEYKDWPTAVASLDAALSLPNPHHALDASQPKRLYHQFELEIEAALAKAKAEIRR